MAYVQEKVYNELVKRFYNNNWSTLKLNMKNGDGITIQPHFADNVEKSAKTAEWFDVINPANIFMSSEDLMVVAKALCNYEGILQQHADDQTELSKFLDTHLKGNHLEDLELGNDINCAGFAIYITEQPEDISLVDFMQEKYIPEYAAEHQLEEEHCRKCVRLSDNWQYYSDWYKEIYSVRPGFPGY